MSGQRQGVTLQGFWPGGILNKPVWSPNHVAGMLLPGSEQNFCTHVEMLAHNITYLCPQVWTIYSAQCTTVFQRLLPQVLSRSGCLTLSFSGSFQIFSILDVWEGTGTHGQTSHLASLNRSHILLQHRPASAEPPLICLWSGGLVGELIKPVGYWKIGTKDV